MKGIGHLGEKDLKERNKLIQEENRRELQKVRTVWAGFFLCLKYNVELF